ncbi:MAG: glycosyltransferase 87 family protein [Actinomycetota bacterium]|nr:glycosyltransferase 87 family protein [Actinomycetota bacterium]
MWPYLGVKPAPTLYFDARNVAAAADCWALGHDPLVDNPCDPWARPMNYPRVWVLLHYIGLSQARTIVFGTIAAVAFLGSLLLLVGRLSVRNGVILAAAVTSPAVMLSIERGNMDLILFAVFVGAVFAWKARDRLTPWLSPALILGAAATKYYAILALPAYAFTSDRRARLAVPAGVAIMAAYIVLTFADLEKVMSAPEGGLLYSYGARIMIGHLYHQFLATGDWLHGNLLAQAIAVVPLVLLTVAAWTWARRRLTPISTSKASHLQVLAFHLGALTYLGTFALRKNGDYRLVFVLLTLPLLLEWAAGARSELRTKLARGGLIAVITGLWVGALSPFIGPWDEVGSWAVAGFLVALMAATVPSLRELLGREPDRTAATVAAG